MLTRYVLADILRNPRRTLSSVVGVTLGVGLFCGVLFLVDGLSASMTQRAVAPLAIDMQRIVTEPAGATVTLSQSFEPAGELDAGAEATVVLNVANVGAVDANEVTVRSQPGAGLDFVVGSATIDGDHLTAGDDNPFLHGSGQTGFNLGTLAPGTSIRAEYRVRAAIQTDLDRGSVHSTFSTRENLSPVPAGRAASVDLRELADRLGAIDGVADAAPLSIAELGHGTIRHEAATVAGPVKLFGFDDRYASRDPTIGLVDGALTADGAVLSAEAASELGVVVGDRATITLPDDSTIELPVTGIADLSRSRSLFSSRRGGDLETFLYVADSVVVSPATFADVIQPAFDRAAAARDGRIKTPPIREVDVSVARERLAADPSAALAETRRIATEIRAVEASSSDYVLDNISNTLAVADADAATAKRLFVFLGVPGGLLAAMLAAYAGTVLAEAQRREQATLRIRGASRAHLLRMLTIRTALVTAAGSAGGLASGYLVAAAVLGRESLSRANPTSLATSAVLGAASGFLATGLALYVTGRRSIDREINEDRARLFRRTPLWRRARLDLLGAAVLVVVTAAAVRGHAFAGTPGSVYFGRGVDLDLTLLALPILVWVVGSLLAARAVGALLTITRPASTGTLRRPLCDLASRSMSRRPWAIGNASIIVALVVTLATSLAGFTASYHAAKMADGRYANGADIRVIPSPTVEPALTVDDASSFVTAGIDAATPVIYAPSNVILRSARTSDPTNVAAIAPATFAEVAPLDEISVLGPTGMTTIEGALASLDADPATILLSRDMATFLRAEVGDTLQVLLARATAVQAEIPLQISVLYDRMPGFPAGVDAVMNIAAYTDAVPTKHPDFFLADASGTSDVNLGRAEDALRRIIPSDEAQIETRLTTLATDQSSLAALNIAGLVDLDSAFSLAMTAVTIGIFVFGLLLQRRREYVTLRAQGLDARTIRLLIAVETTAVAVAGSVAGVVVGVAMGAYFIAVLRPLFVLTPTLHMSLSGVAQPVAIVLVATVVSTLAASALVSRLEPTELLRDE